MEQTKLAHFKRKLLAKKERLENQVKGMEEGGLHQSLRDSIGELSLYDNHPGDIGNEVFERGKDLALRDQAVIQLKNIEETLKNIERGTYGICSGCQRAISEERLEAVPETEYCYDCRLKVEGEGNRHPRPLEEDVIRPPFGDQSVHEPTFFDGEDAWQAVARYGTSETTSDLGEERAQYPDVYVNWDEDISQVEDVDAIPYYTDEDGSIARDYT